MNREQLYREIGEIDDNLIVAADCINEEKGQRNGLRKWMGMVAGISIIASLSSTAYAIEYFKNQNTELYIRHLSPENLELMPDIEYNVDKFFEALKSEKSEYVYIAINRLVECFNDQVMRGKAIDKITPFMHSDEEKIAQAASLAIDILSGNYQNENVYTLADGSVIFTLFNNYSDYGSHNVIWRIKDNVLEEYIRFPEPSMYIVEIIPSPDHSLFAVKTGSNKSEFVVIIDAINGTISPELVGTARGIYSKQKGVDVLLRIDNENYCSVSDIVWKSNDSLLFNSEMTYDNRATIESVSVEYKFSNKSIKVETRE